MAMVKADDLLRLIRKEIGVPPAEENYLSRHELLVLYAFIMKTKAEILSKEAAEIDESTSGSEFEPT